MALNVPAALATGAFPTLPVGQVISTQYLYRLKTGIDKNTAVYIFPNHHFITIFIGIGGQQVEVCNT